MRIACVGGGPAGLYFAILMKRRDPASEITVYERNAPGETFGWGVVFSDETLGYLEENDLPTHAAIKTAFAHWDAIDIHVRGQRVRSGGHGFSGIARRALLEILRARAEELGVVIRFNTEVEDDARFGDCDLVIACDGVNSKLRTRYQDHFEPDLDRRTAKYVWLGTKRIFDSFTFLFEEHAAGLFQVHAYRFDSDTSTFIVETDEATWRRAGLDTMSEAEQIAFLERLFAAHLDGHALLGNRSTWLNFNTLRCRRWSRGNLVLMGDAVHTAHFSIGSGTKLAMEDAISLANQLGKTRDVRAALEAYENERRPIVERTQAAAQDSLLFFEHTKRYWDFEPLKLAFRLLTRSKRIGYDNLHVRDAPFVESVTRAFAEEAGAKRWPGDVAPPPMFTPFRVGDMQLENRIVVSPMCMYSAVHGIPDDFHLVHLGSRGIGGAGLVMAEMTDVSAEGRITYGCAGMYAPEHVTAWRRIVDFVHRSSQAKIGIQLGHAGRKAATKLPWIASDHPLDEGAWPIMSASPLPYFPFSQVPREMDRSDMDRVRDQFVQSARMSTDAGFDLIELHMAHGYLLASFLSPLTNVRTDAYGGSLDNRLRFPLEVLDAVRAAWPKPRPLSVRISATDWAAGGNTGEDGVAISRAMVDHGADIIDVSTGQTTPTGRPAFYGRMYQAPFADQIRNELHVPTMTVGNITSADQANTLLAAGRADLIVLARAHLRDPYFTFHAAEEAGFRDVPWPLPYGLVRPAAKRVT